MPEEGSLKSQIEARKHNLRKSSVARDEVRPNKTAHSWLSGIRLAMGTCPSTRGGVVLGAAPFNALATPPC